jgi:hypothetical protein
MLRMFGWVHRFERGDRVGTQILRVRIDRHRVIASARPNATLAVADRVDRAAGPAELLHHRAGPKLLGRQPMALVGRIGTEQHLMRKSRLRQPPVEFLSTASRCSSRTMA